MKKLLIFLSFCTGLALQTTHAMQTIHATKKRAEDDSRLAPAAQVVLTHNGILKQAPESEEAYTSKRTKKVTFAQDIPTSKPLHSHNTICSNMPQEWDHLTMNCWAIPFDVYALEKEYTQAQDEIESCYRQYLLEEAQALSLWKEKTIQEIRRQKEATAIEVLSCFKQRSETPSSNSSTTPSPILIAAASRAAESTEKKDNTIEQRKVSKETYNLLYCNEEMDMDAWNNAHFKRIGSATSYSHTSAFQTEAATISKLFTQPLKTHLHNEQTLQESVFHDLLGLSPEYQKEVEQCKQAQLRSLSDEYQKKVTALLAPFKTVNSFAAQSSPKHI